MAKSDPVLEAFDRRCLWEVGSWNNDTPFVFLARFQSTAASLGPDERIKLEVCTHDNMELLKTVLFDPHASKICSLRWEYEGKTDVHSVVPLLIINCPELASLEVNFEHHSVVDLVSSVLEHPSSKLKVLEIPWDTKGDFPRFFSALGQSQVSALTISSNGSSEFAQGLCEYLAKDVLVRLKVDTVSSEMIMSLATCTRLAELKLKECEFSQLTALNHLPKSITKLALDNCVFVGGFDWSFLASSNVRELSFDSVGSVDGDQLGSALAALLRAKGLDKLHLYACVFVNETLAAAGVEIGQIKKLDISDIFLNDASIKLIALALQSPSSEMKELQLRYNSDTMNSIKNHLVPALRHFSRNLVELRLWAPQPAHKAAAKMVEDRFYHRRALLVLLQGQQVRRVYCPLRRLPVEMFRLVGEVLL